MPESNQEIWIKGKRLSTWRIRVRPPDIMLLRVVHSMELRASSFDGRIGMGLTFVPLRYRPIRGGGGSVYAYTSGCGGLASIASREIQSYATRRHKAIGISAREFTSRPPDGTHSLQGETKFPNYLHVFMNNKGREMKPHEPRHVVPGQWLRYQGACRRLAVPALQKEFKLNRDKHVSMLRFGYACHFFSAGAYRRKSQSRALMYRDAREN